MELRPLIDPNTGNLARKIRVGLPKGNLNCDPENLQFAYRGCFGYLSKLAGYDIEGYKPGKENDRPNIKRLEDCFEFISTSASELPEQLATGGFDIIITGKDCVEEYLANNWIGESWDQKLDNVDFWSVGRTAYIEKIIPGSVRNSLYKFLNYNLLRKIGKHIDKPLLKRLKKEFANLPTSNQDAYEDYLNHNEIRSWLFPREWVDRLKQESLPDKDSDSPIGQRVREWEWLNFHVTMEQNDLKGVLSNIPSYGSFCQLTDLGMARTDIVRGIPQKNEEFRPEKLFNSVIINSAYPNLAYKDAAKYVPRELIRRTGEFTGSRGGISFDAGYGHNGFAHSIFTGGTNCMLYIRDAASRTEALLKAGACDLIVDCKASGTSFIENKIVELGEPILKDSTTRVYAGTNVIETFYQDSFDDTTRVIKTKREVRAVLEEWINGLNIGAIKYSRDERRKDSTFRWITKKV